MHYPRSRRRGAPRFRIDDPFWLHNRTVFQHITEDDLPWAAERRFKPDSLDQRRWTWVQRALREIAHPQARRAVRMHYLEGRTYAECARTLRCHPATVKRRIDRTLHQLRREARQRPDLWPGSGQRVARLIYLADSSAGGDDT